MRVPPLLLTAFAPGFTRREANPYNGIFVRLVQTDWNIKA